MTSRYEGTEQSFPERRHGLSRPMSVQTFVSFIGLFILLSGAIASGTWWASAIEFKVDQNANRVLRAIGMMQRNSDVLGSLDTLVQRLTTAEEGIKEQRAQTAILQEVRLTLATVIAKLERLGSDVDALKGENRALPPGGR